MPKSETHLFTWLGHSTLLVQDKNGTEIVLDPWLSGNPACPERFKSLSRADLILLTHAHYDHIGDAVPLAKASGGDTVGIFELSLWMGRKGVDRTHPMNKGGTQKIRGVTVTMVHADHSCGISEGDEILYGGEAVGYVVELSDGFRFYHAGDTNVFSDMALIQELYHPELVCLPIGNLYTMGPREAAMAVTFLKPKYVLPLHHGTFPALTGTPEEFSKMIAEKNCQMISVRPGENFSL